MCLENRYDLLVREARLLGFDGTTDIGIKAGKISAIGKLENCEASEMIEAKGQLVLPAFVNAHFHLCKVFTLDWVDDAAIDAYHAPGMENAGEAIDLAARVKAHYSEEVLLPQITRALEWAERYGNLFLRVFADVDGKAGLTGLKAVLKAKELFADRLELQVVAFAQDGIVREPEATALMEEAMQLGADVVGGIPWIEDGSAAQQAHVDEIFRLALKYDAPVSMLLDDAGKPDLRTLEMMCRKAIETGWQGRCLAHHCRALNVYPSDYKEEVLYPLMRDAGVGLVSNPHTGPMHADPRELEASGVDICLGQDDVTDAYYPFGRNNMLEVAFLAAHAWMLTRREEGDKLLEMVTSRAAKAMGLKAYGIEEGNEANLVLVKGDTAREALRFHEPLTVIRKGRIVTPA
ncbi:amidohydrolase family protein [Pelagicoccus albus]|uniref:Amidohydrolase family protein n=1 Tax=Pelagicoccus albus TaxID=415222 RepID=A0A7X1EBK6_9BACT|nr:amidohydrolase family protein [Pelagicoccus albus]MBC2607912.1 amidohydrolase family protein [Pelagicoccus albus]